MAIQDVLSQLGLTLADIGATAGQQAATGLGAITNPLAFQQQQENLRQQRQLQAQQQLHMTMTPYEQAQLGLAQASQERLNRQLDVEQQHWQTEQDNIRQQHQNQLSEFQLTNADRIQPTTADDPNGVAIGGKFFKMKPQSDVVDVGSDILGDLGLNLPEGSTAIRMPIEKAAPLLEQHRKMMLSRSMGGEADNLSNLVDQTFPQGDPQVLILKSQISAAKQQTDPTGMRSMLDNVYKSIQQWNQEYSPAALQKKQDIQRQGQVQAFKLEDELRNPYTPDEVVKGVNALKSQGVRGIQGTNHRLKDAIYKEAAKQGVDILNLTNQEIDNRAKANIALNRIAEVRQLLADPKTQQEFGLVSSRWNDLWTNKIGAERSPRWKQIRDKMVQAQSLLANIHYGVRGGANTEVQKKFNFADQNKMDLPTFMNGLDDVEALTRDYAREGEVTPQSQLGLGDTTTRPSLEQLLSNLPNKGGK